ncbi:MAG TPA: hypothetical protein VMT76_07335 [Puia sp.]|nr:hypothetical protein [Puia sp.]
MKKTFFILGAYFMYSGICFSQQDKWSWFGEIHAGWQATLNAYPYTAQIKPGYENKPFDSSLHYSAFFKNQVPVQLIIGTNTHKGLQFQFSAAYYSMKMALSNPPDVSANENYLFAQSDITALRAYGLIDYHSLFSESSNSKLHFLSGISAGAIIPLNANLDLATKEHFGIESFKKNVAWNLGLDFIMNIDMSRRIYIANSLNAVIPIAGNMGEIQMKNNSLYSAGSPVKITSLTLYTGIGFRF